MPLHVMSCVTISVGILLPLLTITRQTNTNFIITPSHQVVGIGQEAVFRCLHPNITFISWRINESIMVLQGRSGPSGIETGRTLGLDGSVIDFTLTITAQSIYNGTEIVCIATFPGGSVPEEETISVNLTIQGPLSVATDIMRDSSIITWEAPFSLNLTGVDPDIVYCVEVYNITCGVDDLVVGDCNVTEPRLVDNRLQQGFIYRISITPRSSGQDAQNGTNNTKGEMFMSLTDPKTGIMFRSGSTMVTAVIRFRDDGTGIKPASYFLNLMSIDGTEELSNTLFATNFTQDSNVNSITLRVSQPLPYRRLWNCQILALGCTEHPMTSVFDISSHDFQNITVSSSNPGGISVTGDFIPGSQAIGILLVVYSADNDSNIIKYHFVHRSNIRRTITMTNLPSGRYEVSVFVVERNGLPFNRSATTPRNNIISFNEHIGSDVQSVFEYNPSPTSTGVCITCTFLDSSATGCVAVVHQRISQLNSSGLMNIESSHKFNRSGDTAYGCIEGVNMTSYLIGVYSLDEVVPTPPTSPDRFTVSEIVTIVVVVLLIISILLPLLVIIYYKKRKLTLFQSIREHMRKKSRASTTLQRLTTDSSTSQTDDEKMYDKLRGPVKKSQVVAEEVHTHMLGTEEAAAVEEAHGSAPVYSTLGTHPPQSEEGVPSTAIYNILDKNPPQCGVLYTSVNLGQPSGTMGHDDDLHKTATPYSELQQVPQEEESFNKGPGNIYDVTRSDTVTNSDVLSDFNDEVVYIFSSAQEYVIPSELTTLLGDTDDHESTCLLSGEYQSQCWINRSKE